MMGSPGDTGDVYFRRSTPTTHLLRSDYLSVGPLIHWLKTEAPRYVQGVLLDFGCGNRPYEEFFQGKIERYIGVDVVQNESGTVDEIVAPGQHLPFSDSSIDTVLSTQTLEHVAEPRWYLGEVARVLRPGGHLILTCPGTYMLHEEPHDYFRFTEYGLRHLLTSSGLDMVTLTTAGGAWRVVGQTLVNHKAFGRAWRIPVLSDLAYYCTLFCVNLSCGILDSLNTNRKEPANYMLVAKK
jgi:SAM-dependent methyltransferase